LVAGKQNVPECGKLQFVGLYAAEGGIPFSRGEAIGAAAPLDKVNNNFSSHQPFSCNFSLFALHY
jgi:hypothetical protein